MYAFQCQLLPTGRAFLLCLDRTLNTSLTKNMTTNGGCLGFHYIRTNRALQFRFLLFVLSWQVWGDLPSGFQLNMSTFPSLEIEQKFVRLKTISRL